jgi:hypothetical protein
MGRSVHHHETESLFGSSQIDVKAGLHRSYTVNPYPPIEMLLHQHASVRYGATESISNPAASASVADVTSRSSTHMLASRSLHLMIYTGIPQDCVSVVALHDDRPATLPLTLNPGCDIRSNPISTSHLFSAWRVT